MTDEELLREALDSLERVGCGYWMCEGPTLEPIGMVTCHACATVALLRQRLGEPVAQQPEGSVAIRELVYAAYMRRATSGTRHGVTTSDA